MAQTARPVPGPATPDTENRFRLAYANNGVINVDLTSSQAGVADTQLGIGRRLLQTPQYALSLWASVDIPVGDSARLTGNNDLDFALLLAGSSRLGELSSVDANFGAVMPGDSVLPGLDTESLVWFGHVGTHIAINRIFAFKLQLAGHTSYYKKTELGFLSSTLVFVFGGSIKTGACSALDIGMSEDIKVGASPDVSLLISWKSPLGEC